MQTVVFLFSFFFFPPFLPTYETLSAVADALWFSKISVCAFLGVLAYDLLFISLLQKEVEKKALQGWCALPFFNYFFALIAVTADERRFSSCAETKHTIKTVGGSKEGEIKERTVEDDIAKQQQQQQRQQCL